MGLDSFKSGESHKKEESKNQLAESIEDTPCDCTIDEVHRFDDPPDRLDLVAHLREEHGYEFEDAKKKALKFDQVKKWRGMYE